MSFVYHGPYPHKTSNKTCGQFCKARILHNISQNSNTVLLKIPSPTQLPLLNTACICCHLMQRFKHLSTGRIQRDGFYHMTFTAPSSTCSLLPVFLLLASQLMHAHYVKVWPISFLSKRHRHHVATGELVVCIWRLTLHDLHLGCSADSRCIDIRHSWCLCYLLSQHHDVRCLHWPTAKQSIAAWCTFVINGQRDCGTPVDRNKYR